MVRCFYNETRGRSLGSVGLYVGRVLVLGLILMGIFSFASVS